MKKRASKVIIAVVIVLAVLFAAAEFGVRWLIGNQLAQQTETAAEEPHIAFGPAPVLLSLATGVIPRVDITTPSTLTFTGDSYTGTPASQVHMEGLNTKTNTADFMRVTTTLPDEFLTTVAQQALEQNMSTGDFLGELLREVVKISQITSDPGNQAVTVEFTDGAATLTLQPTVTDGQVSFAASDATLLGFDLPQTLVERISQALTQAAEQQAGTGMTIESVEVIEGAVDLTLSGNNVDMQTVEYTVSQ